MIPEAVTVEAGTKASEEQPPEDNEDETIIQLETPVMVNPDNRASQRNTSEITDGYLKIGTVEQSS